MVYTIATLPRILSFPPQDMEYEIQFQEAANKYNELQGIYSDVYTNEFGDPLNINTDPSKILNPKNARLHNIMEEVATIMRDFCGIILRRNPRADVHSLYVQFKQKFEEITGNYKGEILYNNDFYYVCLEYLIAAEFDTDSDNVKVYKDTNDDITFYSNEIRHFATLYYHLFISTPQYKKLLKQSNDNKVCIFLLSYDVWHAGIPISVYDSGWMDDDSNDDLYDGSDDDGINGWPSDWLD